MRAAQRETPSVFLKKSLILLTEGGLVAGFSTLPHYELFTVGDDAAFACVCIA